jgi:serine O-acetyltransferase
VETLSRKAAAERDCLPADAAREECFEAARLNQLIGK